MAKTIPTQLNSLMVGSTIALALCLPLMATALTPAGTRGNPEPAESPGVITQRSRVRRIQFVPGEKSTTIKDSVVLGARDIYLLRARRGQLMTVRVVSLEDNVVFDLTAPPMRQGGQRQMLKQETVTWSGALPRDGEYQVVVGTTRGNGTYQLQVSIR